MGNWHALDCGLVGLNKPSGLPSEVQEAGVSRRPIFMEGALAGDAHLAVTSIQNTGWYTGQE